MEQIKPNELRIGNYVKRKIILEALNEVLYAVVDPIMIRDCAHYGQNWAFEPIPLTGEVLEKAGGIEAGEIILYINESGRLWLDLDKDGDHYNVFIKQTNCEGNLDVILTSREIQYLHQLQNLYFALTGSELEVSLIGNSPITDNK